ncbi:hypothetical protein [Micromonospora sp. NPDC003776]
MVVVCLAAAYCLAAGTALVRLGVRSWRQHSAPGGGMQGIPFTDGFRAGFERATPIFGVFHYLLGVLIAVGGGLRATGRLAAAPQRLPEALAVLLLALLVGVVGSAWAGIAVIWFNRPRWVVPPHLRGQPGSFWSLRRRADEPRRRPRRRAVNDQPHGATDVGTPTGMGMLRVAREPASWRDKWRAYRILVDGFQVGKVRRGESSAVMLTPGVHHVRLRIDWCTSPEVSVDISAGEQCDLECGAARSELGNARQMREAPDTYLWLRPAGRGRHRVAGGPHHQGRR